MNKYASVELSSTALLRAVNARLRVSGGVFSNRVYNRYAPPQTPLPYVVLTIAGGGDRNLRHYRDAELLIQVVCYANSGLESSSGAQTIDDTLDDHGEQDHTVSPLLADTPWHILTVTGERIISRTEHYDNVKPVFADGKTYRVTMETGY